MAPAVAGNSGRDHRVRSCARIFKNAPRRKRLWGNVENEWFSPTRRVCACTNPRFLPEKWRDDRLLEVLLGGMLGPHKRDKNDLLTIC